MSNTLENGALLCTRQLFFKALFSFRCSSDLLCFFDIEGNNLHVITWLAWFHVVGNFRTIKKAYSSMGNAFV